MLDFQAKQIAIDNYSKNSRSMWHLSNLKIAMIFKWVSYENCDIYNFLFP